MKETPYITSGESAFLYPVEYHKEYIGDKNYKKKLPFRVISESDFDKKSQKCFELEEANEKARLRVTNLSNDQINGILIEFSEYKERLRVGVK